MIHQAWRISRIAFPLLLLLLSYILPPPHMSFVSPSSFLCIIPAPQCIFFCSDLSVLQTGVQFSEIG